MNEILITFIVPIYNVEKYIDACIKSILKISSINMQEIILIDDGSTDNSGKIADNYAVRYSNIKCFHKPNGGLSDARNFGLKRASGKYVCFIDSDDTVEPDSIVTYSPAYASLRGGGFSLKYSSLYSINELSPCVPRFLFLFYANAILIPSFRMFTAAFISLS